MRRNKMIEYREGAKIISLCAHCEKKVSSTLSSETLSICNGLKEVENVLVRICEECGNIVSTPHRSVSPIQRAIKYLVETGAVPNYDSITIELKSIVDREEGLNSKPELDYNGKYPLVAAE